jgi:hypothetical protein
MSVWKSNWKELLLTEPIFVVSHYTENAPGVIAGFLQEKEHMAADVSALRATANGGKAEHARDATH